MPSVSGVNPTSGLRSGGDEVTITGTNLVATSVDFGGTPTPFTINPDGSITAISPPGSDGTVDVTASHVRAVCELRGGPVYLPAAAAGRYGNQPIQRRGRGRRDR